MHLRALSALAAVLPLAAPSLFAAPQDGRPRVQQKLSPRGIWHMELTWGDGKDQSASVLLKGPEGVETSFELPFPSSPLDTLLTDEGALYCLDDRSRPGMGVAVVACDAAGGVRWTRTVEDLVPAELIAQMPAGQTSRHWRMRPQGIGLEPDENPTTLVLHLWNEDRVHLDIESGEARYEKVLDHGQDAQAWYASARALMSNRDYETALPELRQVVEIEPKHLMGWSELGTCLEKLERIDESLDAMREGALRNPISKRTEDPRYRETKRNIWLHTRLAQAYHRAGKEQDALRTALACAEIEPARWDAVEIYADIEWNRGEIERVNELLVKTWRHLAAPAKGGSRERKVSDAAFRIGGFYLKRERFAQAKDYYLRGFERGTYNEALHRNLSKVHAELGEFDEAVEVLAVVLNKLLQRSTEMPAGPASTTMEKSIRRLEEEVMRLDDLSRQDD